MSDPISRAYEELRAVEAKAAPKEAKLKEPLVGSSETIEANHEVAVDEVACTSAPSNVLELIGAPVDFDDDSLEAAGLLAPDNPDYILRQFRRIKRPIIGNAFQIGMTVEENANVVAVTSALPGAGKSFVSLNLVLSLARERDVGAVLVDVDVLKPKLSASLGLQGEPGLIDYLDSPTMAIEEVVRPTSRPGLSFIPAGRNHPDATELLGSSRMKDTIGELATRFNKHILVLDTSPLLLTSEAQAVAAHAGQILLVVQEGVTTQSGVKDALKLLDPDKPINAVLNKAAGWQQSSYDAQYYGYVGYGNQE